MSRFVVYVLGGLVLIGLVLLPALTWEVGSDSVASGGDATSITRYRADFTVSRTGDLSAVETIDVAFPTSGRHSVLRTFDRRDPHAPHARRTPADITVTRDGQRETWTTERREHGRFVVLRIGDPDRTLTPGVHRYVISYTIPGVLLRAARGESTFLWDVVPGGWRPAMTDVTATVTLPVATPVSVRCGVGRGAAAVPCTPTGTGTTTLRVHLDSLAPQTPITLLTPLTVSTPAEGGHVPWTMRWDAVLGTRTWLAVVVALVGLFGALAGAVLGSRARERTPPFPRVDAPPPGLSPAQGAYLLRETIPRQAFVATLFDGAQRGTVVLDRTEEGWTLTAGATPAGDDPAWNATRRLAGDGTFVASKRDVEAGRRLQDEITSFKTSLRGWAVEQGFLSRTGLAGSGGVLVVVGVALAVATVLVDPFSMTLLGVVPAVCAVAGCAIAAAGAGTRRTRAGRELWSQLGGFRRVLSTPSGEERFDFSGRHQLYTAYIPWAVAFDCAAEWAQKYRTELGTEPPVPSYFGSYAAGAALGGHNVTADLVRDFDTTVNSAIASYTATRTAPAGGGGGGSW